MLNPNSERELRNLVETKDIYYVELAHVKELLDEVDRLRKLAYIGEHHFTDLTYKARLEETVHDLREAQAQLENALDADKEGSWMARALDAERHRDVLKDQLKYAESYTNLLTREQFEDAKYRAMIAERERDELKALLAHTVADAEQAVHNEAFMERQRIAAWLRTTPSARGTQISIHSSQDISRLADAIELGDHNEVKE